MKNKVCGKFPDFCYRAFDREEYAKQFMDSGKFRLNCRYYCRHMEDASRCDPTEGCGHTKERGIVTVCCASPNPAEKTIWTRKRGYQERHIEMGNPIFCFCTCLPEVNLDHMKENFGKYIVKINNPKKLAEEINDYLFDKGQRFLIEGCRVVYNKGEKLDKKLTDNERLNLAYKQKPEKFWPDCEFRIVAIKFRKSSEQPCELKCKYLSGQSEPCKFIDVNLNKKCD